MPSLEKRRQLVEDVRAQWKSMWRQRIDDKVCAEGITDKDYSLLFMERGTVIRATRKFRPPDFFEILQKHGGTERSDLIPPDPHVGGWGKFIRTVLKRQSSSRRQRKRQHLAPMRKVRQQLKKGGRGWLRRL